MPKTTSLSKPAAKKAAKPRRRKVRRLPNEITQAVGKAIRVRRQALEMTQLNLSMAGEIERTRVSKLELGLVNPSVLSLASICHVLGITLADLFADIRLSHPPTTEGGAPRRANQATLDKPTKPLTKAKAAELAVTKHGKT